MCSSFTRCPDEVITHRSVSEKLARATAIIPLVSSVPRLPRSLAGSPAHCYSSGPKSRWLRTLQLSFGCSLFSVFSGPYTYSPILCSDSVSVWVFLLMALRECMGNLSCSSLVLRCYWSSIHSSASCLFPLALSKRVQEVLLELCPHLCQSVLLSAGRQNQPPGLPACLRPCPREGMGFVW